MKPFVEINKKRSKIINLECEKQLKLNLKKFIKIALQRVKFCAIM